GAGRGRAGAEACAGVRAAPEPVEPEQPFEPAPLPVEPVLLDGPLPLYPCHLCPQAFPSAAARQRHIDFNHEAPPEPPSKPREISEWEEGRRRLDANDYWHSPDGRAEKKRLDAEGTRDLRLRVVAAHNANPNRRFDMKFNPVTNAYEFTRRTD